MKPAMHHLLVLGTILFGLVGCQPPPPVRLPAAAPAAQAATVAPAGYLPASTVALALVADPLRLADALGRRRLLEEYREAYERAFFAVMEELDADLTSPEGLREAGIDPRGPAAVAWLEAGREDLVVAFTLADVTRFKAAVARAARVRERRVESEVHGEGLVLSLRGDDELALVVREGMVLVVLGDGPPEPLEVAGTLAELEPSRSLLEHEPFQKAVRGFDGWDVMLYANLGPPVRWAVGLDPRWAGTTGAAAAQALEAEHGERLAEAGALAAPVDEMVAIDEEYRAARQLLRRDPAAERLRAVAGALGPAAVALEVLPNGVRARGRLAVEPQSLLARLLAPAPRSRAVAKRLSERPELLLQLSLDVDAAAEAAQRLWPELDRLEEALQVDLDGELKALLRGDVGVALDVDLRRAWPREEVGEPRVVAFVGVNDEARARKLLASLARAPDLRQWLRPAAGGGYRIEPRGIAPLWLGVRDSELVIRTDQGRAPGERTTGPDHWTGTGHRLLARFAGHPGASVVVGGSLGWWLALSEEGRGSGYGGEREDDSSRPENAAPADGQVVPEAARLQVAVDELDQRIRRLSDDMDRRAAEERLSFARRLGLAALEVERTSAGVAFEAGWVVGDRSLAALLAELPGPWLGRDLDDASTRQRWDVLQGLMDRRAALREQLEQLRKSPPPEPAPEGEPEPSSAASDAAPAGAIQAAPEPAIDR